jgi:hypothetical protein
MYVPMVSEGVYAGGKDTLIGNIPGIGRTNANDTII